MIPYFLPMLINNVFFNNYALKLILGIEFENFKFLLNLINQDEYNSISKLSKYVE